MKRHRIPHKIHPIIIFLVIFLMVSIWQYLYTYISAEQQESIPSVELEHKEVLIKPIWATSANRRKDVITQLAKHWTSRAAVALSFCTRNALDTNTTKILSDLGLVSSSDYCIALFTFDGKSFASKEEFQYHCNGSQTRPIMANRVKLYEAIFNSVMEENPASRHWLSFDFYVDVTSGSRLNPALQQSLSLPVLTQSQNPLDRHGIPLPDSHTFLALLDRSKYARLIPAAMQSASKVLHLRYQAPPAFPFENKQSRLVYRASCIATLDSYSVNPGARLPIRADLCKLYWNSTLFDIGLSVKTNRNMNSCPCCLCNKSHLDVSYMRNFKYQLNVDGHGASYDANAWKLLSNSTVFFLIPDKSPEQLVFEAMLYPALLPFVHYVPATVSNLTNAVQWCMDNEVRCASIAASGMSVALELFDVDAVLRYTFQILDFLHENVRGLG